MCKIKANNVVTEPYLKRLLTLAKFKHAINIRRKPKASLKISTEIFPK